MAALSKTEYSLELQQTIRSSIALTNVESLNQESSAVLLILPPWAYFVSEFAFEELLETRGIFGIHASLARSEVDGVYKLFVILHSLNKDGLMAAVRIVREILPQTAVRLTFLDKAPINGIGRQFYFAIGPFRVCYNNIRQRHKNSKTENFYFFLTTEHDRMYQYTTIPGYINKVAPSVAEKNMYEVNGKGNYSRLLNHGRPGAVLTYEDYNHPVVRIFWQNRKEWDNLYFNNCTSHPYEFHNSLTPEQESAKIDLVEVLPAINNPFDKMQYLNVNFRFGISAFQVYQANQNRMARAMVVYTGDKAESGKKRKVDKLD